MKKNIIWIKKFLIKNHRKNSNFFSILPSSYSPKPGLSIAPIKFTFAQGGGGGEREGGGREGGAPDFFLLFFSLSLSLPTSCVFVSMCLCFCVSVCLFLTHTHKITQVFGIRNFYVCISSKVDVSMGKTWISPTANSWYNPPPTLQLDHMASSASPFSSSSRVVLSWGDSSSKGSNK